MLQNIFLGLVFLLLGLAFIEAGVLSVLVSVAYSDLKGSAIPAISGTLLVLCGGFAVVRAKRRFFRKDES
jgi:uncharacterized membrane protein HdeD (DUF308 family)